MSTRITAIILSLCIASPVWARRPCEDDDDRAAALYQQAQQYRGKINELNAMIPHIRETRRLVAERMPGFKDSAKNCQLFDRKNKNDVDALKLAIELLKQVTVFDHTLAARLVTILENEKEPGDWSLSDLLKNYADRTRLTGDERMQILSMAKAFELLSEKDQAWKSEERQWLKSVKADLKAIKDLIPRLQNIYEDKLGSDKNLVDSCNYTLEQIVILEEQESRARKAEIDINFALVELERAINQADGIRNSIRGCPLKDDSRMVR